tara:strand:+ start:16501 stop:17832 length:1332 start_codon:yes stop_codon:yes gene_type:complete
MLRKTLFTAVAFVCLGAMPVYADTNIIFIVDASGSMKEKVENQTRMEAAKDVLGKTLEGIPKTANLGLMVYGHRNAKDCSDIELVSPLGGDDAATLQKTISTLEAKGETPIAESIRQASKSFAAFKGQDNKIILVTDGLEECQGDPCAAAKEVKASGLDVTVNVVGFTLGEEEAKAVQCITEATGGKYYGAADVEALTTALQEAATSEPEPAASTVTFEDNFDGAELASHWDVMNPNPEQYIVENNDLLLIGKDVGGLSNAESSNILQLMEDLPSGDWTITVELTPEFQTSKDVLSFGLYTDNKNYVATSIVGHKSYCCDTGSSGYAVVLTTVKMSGGEQTQFDAPIAGPSFSPNHSFKEYIEGWGKTNVKTTVQLVKEGRSYKSRLHQDGKSDEEGNPLWVETNIISSLRAPKQFVINAGQTEENTGESVFNIHSVKIETQE